jgi:hypothetical protein
VDQRRSASRRAPEVASCKSGALQLVINSEVTPTSSGSLVRAN